MKILFNIGHPAHVHLFKNLIRELERRGHHCKITAIAKDVSLYLLDAYGFEYEVVGQGMPTLTSKAIELVRIEARLYRIARSFMPDLLVGGVGNVYVAHIGKLIRKPSIVFDDTEHAKIDHLLMDPFVNVICTPSCYRGDLGPKQVRYNGYHELAYLHPYRFTPNPAVLDELSLSEGDPFIIIRFVSWQASHDVGQHGLDLDMKRKAIHEFEKYGRVLITSEKNLPQEFEKYRISVSPEKMHDLLSYATLLYGESATMASECAVLGTHAIFCDFAGRGYTDEEENVYNLVYNFKLDESSQEKSIETAVKLLCNRNLKREGQKKRRKLLNDKIDVTKFMVWFLENYPISLAKIQHNPNIFKEFK
jgi:uncharacterized protein